MENVNTNNETQEKFQEEQKIGTVGLDVYKDYMSTNSTALSVMILIFFMTSQILYSLCDWWISVWYVNYII